MNDPLDRGRDSDDPLRRASRWAGEGNHAERPDRTRSALDPDAPARPSRDFAEENISQSATPPLSDGPRIEWARVEHLVDPNTLDLDIPSETVDLDIPPETARRAHGTFGRLAVAISIATVAVIATLLTVRTLSTGWTGGTGGRTAQADSTDPQIIGRTQAAVESRTQGAEELSSSPRVRLAILRAPPGGAGDAIPLGVSLAGASGDAALLISGLPAGSTISTGISMGADNWLLSASELSNAAVRPPPGFVGAINLAIELRLADDTVADRQSLRLTWVGTPETATAITAAPTTAVTAPVGIPSIGTPNSQATSAPLRRLDHEEIADLLKRGEEFVAAGNLGPARLALRRAAEAGDPRAAFVLATTYDPILLGTRRVIGVAPDIAMARTWYEKAKELGSTDASRRLELLASRDR